MIRDAWISDCTKYRYWLSRTWDSRLPNAVWIMLNPSVADSKIDDMTIKKCVAFSTMFGCGSLSVVNLYAYRATDPKDLWRGVAHMGESYMIGSHNDNIIKSTCETAHLLIAGWGAHARRSERAKFVHNVLLADRQLVTLKTMDDGTPFHPLMLPYTSVLKPLQRRA